MIKQYVGLTLYRQLALVLLAALALSGALYFLASHVLEEAVCAYYDGHPEVVRQKAEARIDALQSYVADRRIAVTDRAALSEWVAENPLLVIQIHQGGRLVFDSTRQASAALHTHMNEHSPSTTQLIKTVAFAGGAAQVSIAVFPEHMLVDRLNTALLLICAGLFLFVTLLGVRSKIRYIVLLEREVLAIAGGQLTLPITRCGEDELANLADCIDEMRLSLTQRVRQEESRQRERYDWITSLSHDIRTPLTSLIGYLEVLQKSELPEAQRGYAVKSAQKAAQLKQITDMLFSCLSPNASLTEMAQTITMEAFAQSYLAGCVETLREAGFAVDLQQAAPLHGQVVVHAAATQRVFGNICANIEQYASPDAPIRILFSGDGSFLALEIQSASSPQETTHGTGLGLQICENLMQNMGGGFSARAQNDCFVYRLSFRVFQT